MRDPDKTQEATAQDITRAADVTQEADYSFGDFDRAIGATTGAKTTRSPQRTRELPTPQLDSIGRYRIDKTLGQGGFGSVYLAYDDELQRFVTIKVPHPHRVRSADDVQKFLEEARTLAKLEHANVVPVHDVGQTSDGICYMVSRYIDGKDLFERIRNASMPIGEATELVATIAEALHYVHNAGVIHRDIKPRNILLDKRGTAYLADFGLALVEEDAIRSSTIAGTPAYMSPEQARGENHLVTGASDIYSLGVMLYQLLTARLPFEAENTYAVLQMIQELEPQPLRELNRDIPSELERICLKALSKRASSRQMTALDFATDLRHFLSQTDGAALLSSSRSPRRESNPASDLSRSSRQFLGIVPRGLRSFGSQDAHFFQGLLPGPYDRDGMPESISFWKRQIEESDPETGFRVGLIYGPSGCGKSSFVKAGLVPSLSRNVTTILIEAAPNATEKRLLNRLRRSCPYLDTSLGLKESLATLRNGKVMGNGQKVLIVLDQFEQWLYSVDQAEHSELARALRQCDGEHVQCILLIRDDFWLTFSRFMDHLEIEMLQNRNMSLIDLFDARHAQKVLVEFGRAFHRLPELSNEFSKDQQTFITKAIEGLSEHGKVTPVRLALFAEMIKNSPWTTTTLKRIGGTDGVGVMFLDENFTSDIAPADYRIHLNAVHGTLGALLPQPGTNLKGHMKSEADLLQASGYVGQPKQFQAMLRVLDAELHLITRTDPEGRGDATLSQAGMASGNRSEELVGDTHPKGAFYQLAHDYLVPSIREWQSRMQRGSRKGRAQIRLAQRAEVWTARPEKRHLPSLFEWTSALALVPRREWDETQQKMMSAAARRYTGTLTAAGVLVALAVWGALQMLSWNKAIALTDQLAVAKVAEVSGLLDQLEGRERWTKSRLFELQAQAEVGSPEYLFSSLALLRSGEDELDKILPSILDADPVTLTLLCDELTPHQDHLKTFLWEKTEDETLERIDDKNGQRVSPRFNAGMALSSFAPPMEAAVKDRFAQHSKFFADELIYFADTDRRNFSAMVELAKPATPILVPHLDQVITAVESNYSESQRNAAMQLLRGLLEEEPAKLVDILLHASVSQVLSAIKYIDKHEAAVRPVFDRALAVKLDIGDPMWKKKARRKSTAAALLLRHGASNSNIWAVFKPEKSPALTSEEQNLEWVTQELRRLVSESEYESIAESGETDAISKRYREVVFGRTDIPNARTHLVQRVRPLGVNPQILAQRLLVEQDVVTQCGLAQALGTYPRESVNPDLADRISTLVKGWFVSAKVASLRANALRFLVLWEEDDWVANQLDAEPSVDSENRNWYVNSQGHTMIRLPQHQPEDTYRIAAAMAEVTLEQLERWMPGGGEKNGWSAPTTDCSVGKVNYHEAVAYCNWLSREEGLGEDELCYPDRETDSSPSARLYDDYRERTGYRLPMADEWFFMCCGGAITDYSFGSGSYPFGLYTDELRADGYGPERPTDGKRSWPVGAAWPNQFGIFDAYMNLREWTNNVDPNDPSRIQLCGLDYRWSWTTRGAEPRYIGWIQPGVRSGLYGFRVFRSKPTSQLRIDSSLNSPAN